MRRIVAARALRPFKVWLRYSDRSEGVVDLSELVARGGVFDALRDPELFGAVSVERGFGTIEWPGESDLDPDVHCARMHGTTAEALLGNDDSR